jgi:tetratricopeptide (TPR) repeat protein
MGKLILLFVGIFSCFTFSCFSQERQDEQRAQLDIKMLGQSERLSKITGWSKFENAEGRFWKQSDANSIKNYLPGNPDEGFEYFQMFKFRLEGEIFYILNIKYDEERMRQFAFTSSSFERLKNIVETADGQTHYAVDIKDCEYTTKPSVYDPFHFDPEESIKNKEMIRLLLTGKGSYSTSNFCKNDSLFLINSQMLKGESIVRFNLIPWNNTDFRDNNTIWPLDYNYFELKKNEFEKLFRFTPYGNDILYFKLGEEKYNTEDYSGAILNYSKAIEINPKNLYYYYNRGSAKLNSDDYIGAINDFTKSIELNLDPKGGAGAYQRRGTAKFYIKDNAGASADFSKAIELDPKDYVSYSSRGYLKLESLDYTGAIDDYSKAIALNPKSYYYYINRGDAKTELKDYTGAINDYTTAIKLDPLNASGYIYRSRTKVRQGQYNDAILDCNIAIEIAPKEVGAFCNRANAKYYIQDYTGAIADCEKALEINPNVGAAYNHRGKARIKLGQKEKGCTDLNKAVEFGYPEASKNMIEFCN